MKVLDKHLKGQLYRFEYMESIQRIYVMKGDAHEPDYVLTKLKSGWSCYCWGFTRWKHCKHHDAFADVLAQPDVDEPWAEWAEEAAFLNQQIHPQAAVR